MKTKIILFLLSFLLGTSVFSQSNVNDYKYVVVPNTFDFLKEENKFQLNDLSKFLLEKYGFEVFMENETLPNEALANNCLALDANVLKEKGMFKTKLKIELKNCEDKVVYTSSVGESREKSYKVAYTMALREAFKSFETLNYQYKPNKNITNLGSENTNIEREKEIKELKEEIKQLKQTKPEPELEEKENVVITTRIEEPKLKKNHHQELTKKELTTNEILYAQSIPNGYQLVDSSPKVVMTLYKSGVDNLYIVKGKDAIVYKNGEDWIYSETNSEKLTKKSILIKF